MIDVIEETFNTIVLNPSVRNNKEKLDKIKRIMVQLVGVNGWDKDTKLSQFTRFKSFEDIFSLTITNLLELTDAELDSTLELLPKVRRFTKKKET